MQFKAQAWVADLYSDQFAITWWHLHSPFKIESDFATPAWHEANKGCLQTDGNQEPIHFRHAAAEETGLPDSSQDLVSACLLFHELPEAAAQAIIKEAYRILKPGGLLAIMVCTAYYYS